MTFQTFLFEYPQNDRKYFKICRLNFIQSQHFFIWFCADLFTAELKMQTTEYSTAFAVGLDFGLIGFEIG